jgi:hypothetical protein
MPGGWFSYMQGKNPGYPDKVLEDTYTGMCSRLERIERDSADVETWDVHHWQNLNPVIPEGLIQMAMGTPAAVYHGGLLHASVRYFDPQGRRPGLPEHVAALGSKVTPEGIDLELVNTDPLASREVLVQGGMFGEHEFTTATLQDAPSADQDISVNAKYLRVCLGPSSHALLHLGLKRFAHLPSYAFPPFE